jgi:hypothetical protein
VGIRTNAIDMGPVPNNFQSIFEYLVNKDELEIQTTEFPSGYTGEQFKTRKGRVFNADLFTENELFTLEKVANAFKETSTLDIIELSHLEEAWKKNEKKKSVISYEFAFELNPF